MITFFENTISSVSSLKSLTFRKIAGTVISKMLNFFIYEHPYQSAFIMQFFLLQAVSACGMIYCKYADVGFGSSELLVPLEKLPTDPKTWCYENCPTTPSSPATIWNTLNTGHICLNEETRWSEPSPQEEQMGEFCSHP